MPDVGRTPDIENHTLYGRKISDIAELFAKLDALQMTLPELIRYMERREIISYAEVRAENRRYKHLFNNLQSLVETQVRDFFDKD